MDINSLALKLLNPNGHLITCSCSQHLTMPLFIKMIKESAIRAGVTAEIVELAIQGQDHPMLLSDEEALYLKCAVIRRF